MRAVLQRVSTASVRVEEVVVGSIDRGLAVLIGFADGDTPELATQFALKVVELRVFEDHAGKMNRSIIEAGGSVLAVSQFTLYGNTRRGRRPSFEAAAAPSTAEPLYEAFCQAVVAYGVACSRGVFGAHMALSMTNDGPVTIILDSAELSRPRRT